MIQITSKIFSKGLTFPHFTTIQTDFELAEIIALRADGTSESTNPESMEMRELDKQRQIAAAMNVVSDQVSADFMGIVDNRDAEIERLKSELKSANKNLQTTRSVIQAANNRLRTEVLETQESRDQLKRELGEMHSAIAEPAEREAVQRVLHGVRPDLYESPGPIGGTIRPDDVVTFGKPPCSQCWCSEENVKLHVERNKIAGRLSKCREGKRAIAANYNSLVGTVDQIKRALGNCNSSDIVPIITGLQSTIAKLHIAESGRFTDERNALASELSQAKAELQRLKTQFSPPKPIFNMAAQTVYGMTLDEVRGLKADRHELRLALEKANRKLSHIKQTLG